MHRLARCYRLGLVILIGMALSACAVSPTPSVAPAPVATSTDLDGHPQNPLALANERKATVLLFITNDCPISNGYAPEIHRLCDAYTRQGIAFYLVYSDPELSAAEARQHYKDFAYTCPALLDPKHQLANQAGATVTPEVAVYLSDGRLIYRGRINDLYLDYGKSRFTATTNDLKDVLESIAQNRPLTMRTTQAVGCPIPM